MKRILFSLISMVFFLTTANANDVSVFDRNTDKVDVAKLLSQGLAKINETFALDANAEDAVLYTQSRWDLNSTFMKDDFLVAVRLKVSGQENLIAAYSINAEGVETIGLVSANPDGKLVYSEPTERGALYLKSSTEEAATEYGNKLNREFPNLNARGRYGSHVTFQLNKDLEQVIEFAKGDGAIFDLNTKMYVGTTVLDGPYLITKLPAIQNYSEIKNAKKPLKIDDFGSNSKACSAIFR